MNHFAITRTNALPDGLLCLDVDDLAPGQGKLTCNGEADHAGANDNAVDAIHRDAAQNLAGSKPVSR